MKGNRRRALSNVTALVTLLRSAQKNVCGIPAIGSCVKEREWKRIDIVLQWCIYFVEENLDFKTRLLAMRNDVLKHKILQMFDNINGCDIYYVYYDDCVYSYLATYHYVIRGFRDQNYSEFRSRTDIKDVFLYDTYMFNVVEECENIYIEIRSHLDREFQTTIDAKTIIPKLNVPLEDKEKIKKYEKH